MIQGTETAIYENEASVRETANTITREHSEDTPGEEVTKSFSNTARKPDDVTVIRKICKNVSNDEKLEKSHSILEPDINYNFPTANSSEKFKRRFSEVQMASMFKIVKFSSLQILCVSCWKVGLTSGKEIRNVWIFEVEAYSRIFWELSEE